MDQDQLRPMELPGSGAFVSGERTPRLWTYLWALWGLIIAGLIFVCDGNIIAGVCFLAWGMAMSLIGWQVFLFGFFAVIDWAKHHLTDRNVEREARNESFAAANVYMEARKASGLDPPDSEELLRETLGHETPLQRKWLQQEVFAAITPAPWFMGLAHGLGVGTLLGALLGLIPDDGVSITNGAISGCIIGIAGMVCLTAIISALFSPGQCITPRHRLLVIVSPVFVFPALLEAALLWGRWYANRQKRAINLH